MPTLDEVMAAMPPSQRAEAERMLRPGAEPARPGDKAGTC